MTGSRMLFLAETIVERHLCGDNPVTVAYFGPKRDIQILVKTIQYVANVSRLTYEQRARLKQITIDRRPDGSADVWISETTLTTSPGKPPSPS